MTPSYQRIANQHFLFDPTILETMTPDLFDPEIWRRKGKAQGEARGRGSVLFIGNGHHEFVLRHYRRGGFISKFLTDHYGWQGLRRTRAWAEWHLLHRMFQEGLPVPKPAAARVVRHGFLYTADLLTLTLPNCRSLADHLQNETWRDELLYNIGKTIRDFHHAGIYHADLNAHNILVNDAGRIYLLDFDRGCQKSGTGWKGDNLSRLHRSVSKIKKDFPEEKWRQLMQGYETT